jgi:hypothetical protein
LDITLDYQIGASWFNSNLGHHARYPYVTTLRPTLSFNFDQISKEARPNGEKDSYQRAVGSVILQAMMA